MLIVTASFSTYELDGFFKVRPNLESFSSIVMVTFSWAAQERLSADCPKSLRVFGTAFRKYLVT